MAPIPKPRLSPVPTPSALRASPPPPADFPLAALGPRLSATAAAIAARTQAPMALVAHQLLTLAAMAAQRLVSIRLPTGARRPVSCWFATLVGTGEGSGAVEACTVDDVRRWEDCFDDEYLQRLAAYGKELREAKAAEANASEPRPTRAVRPEPLETLDLFLVPRAPGPRDRYARLTGMTGLFAHHPHDLVHPFRRRREEVDSLCRLWDGAVHETSVGKPFFPRLSLHLVATPREGRALLADRTLADGGLLGRMLVLEPPSRIGARTWTVADADEAPPAWDELFDVLGDLYAQPATTDSRVVAFADPARAAWLAFANEVEEAMGEGEAFASIRPLAGHLAEHAARLAAVIALVNDDTCADLGVADLENGLALARFYAGEALRLNDLAPPPLSDSEKAAIFEDWLARRPGQEIRLRDICSSGPRVVRNSARACLTLMREMEMRGIVVPSNDNPEGAPEKRRGTSYLWRVVSPETAAV